jgi:hypothetical protein
MYLCEVNKEKTSGHQVRRNKLINMGTMSASGFPSSQDEDWSQETEKEKIIRFLVLDL